MHSRWRDHLIDRRFLPNRTVYHGLVTVRDGGQPGRPGPALPGVPNFYGAGDWVGTEGLLAYNPNNLVRLRQQFPGQGAENQSSHNLGRAAILQLDQLPD